MQKVVWIGEKYFAPALMGCGFEQVEVLAAPAGKIFSWQDILSAVSYIPDLVIVAAGGCPSVLGVEQFPCLTVLYSTASHIHPWHRLYAQAFDACVVSHADHVGRFEHPYLTPERVWWLPPFAPDLEQVEAIPRVHSCVIPKPSSFSPATQTFIHNLTHQIPGLEIVEDINASLYRASQIIIHLGSEPTGLDFDLFTAMACGSCVVTPRTGHGLEKLFVDGEQLVGFALHDAGDAAYRVNFLLENPDLIHYIGYAAKTAIEESHRAINRAWSFTDYICDLLTQDISEIIRQRIALAPEIVSKSLAVPYMVCAGQLPAAAAKNAFLAAAKGVFGLKGSTAL